ncbi:hypothetical protein Efla_001027 [Eimeria flavescens]
MARPHSIFPKLQRHKRVLSVGDEVVVKRRATESGARTASLNNLLLLWTLKRLSGDIIFQKLRSFLICAVSSHIACLKASERCLVGLPYFRPFRENDLQSSQLDGSLEAGTWDHSSSHLQASTTCLFTSSAGEKLPLECPIFPLIHAHFRRGSVDAIRLLLRHKDVPHVEYHVDQSIKSQEIACRFEAAGLPATLPYYSDDRREMTGSRTILKYLAVKTRLAGSGEEEAVRIDSILEFCFAALHTLWSSECTCAYPRELSKERARAHYCRDKVLPVLQTLCSLVSLHAATVEEDEPDAWTSSSRQAKLRARECRWIIGEASSLLQHPVACAHIQCREFGSSTLLPFTRLRCFMERVEAYSKGIQIFCDSELRF